ncbi:hypothetical protein LX73_0827 [Fodinibius salinus]|uniref:Uncharacterized protein n=1 Tax=Fodinibius salinus TaxID=860790 RepID=A0A5D3YNL4_9BACT|nr:hypothetical protein [Fodinibius salinus]TYP95520.1 hypothetical protein LX73_0827 [Fodinibius salinus]
MKKRRFYIWLSVAIMLIMSMNLIISTLHSHHNLELHNSTDFADTGQCLSADNHLCPICGYILQTDPPSDFSFADIFLDVTEVVKDRRDTSTFSPSYNIRKGRSPPMG